jgi:hypothetical protein
MLANSKRGKLRAEDCRLMVKWASDEFHRPNKRAASSYNAVSLRAPRKAVFATASNPSRSTAFPGSAPMTRKGVTSSDQQSSTASTTPPAQLLRCWHTQPPQRNCLPARSLLYSPACRWAAPYLPCQGRASQYVST